MTDVGGHDRVQEMARDLGQHLSRALDEGSPSRSLEGARQAARGASLAGLDRLLAALTPYAIGPWPAPLRPVVDRLRSVATECARAGHLDGFRRHDEEFGLMARAIERVSLARVTSPVAARPAPGDAQGVSLAEVLDGIPGQRAGTDVMRRVKLLPHVAGSLRAALDWLLGGNHARMRMWLTSDGSALDVTCEGIAFTGIQPAAEVLSSVGGHLGPAGDRPGAWTVRVPIRAERETFLMVEQDELQLAVPWPAVVRVRLIPAETIEMMLRRQTLPVLPRLAEAAHLTAEQPVAVVALGLKRACLVADRLVWRMPASPAEVPGPAPAHGLRRAVRSDDGEVYWVLEPEWLLRAIPVPSIGQAAPRPGAPSSPPGSASERTPAGRPPIPFPGKDAPPSADASTPTALPTLGAEHVEPLAAPAQDRPEDSATAPEPEDHSSGSAGPAGPLPGAHATGPAVTQPGSVRRALVAEDSIASRIYLVRLLEQQGYVVRAVPGARELREALAGGGWALVCVDAGLADVGGGHVLSEIAGAASGAVRVALVRDADDENAARGHGFDATLRKPYEREALERILSRAANGRRELPAGAHDPDPRDWGAR